jgi:citrate lyase beta subunit
VAAENGRTRYARLRSILEVPILTERFWSKVPTVAADAIMIDLEDSVTPANKIRARDAMVAALAAPEYFGGRQVIVRVNNLSTPWGRADLDALAKVPDDVLACYPKVETPAEIAEVRAITGPTRGLYVMIETARAMMELDRIAGGDGVVGLHFGYVDYAADVGSIPFAQAGDELFAPSNYYAQSQVAVAAAAYGLFATGGTLIPEYREMEKVRRFVRRWSELGYTACIAVSPAHLDAINELMGPSEDQVRAARAICDCYEDAVRRGEPAAVVGAKVITLPDYRVAQLTLARSR